MIIIIKFKVEYNPEEQVYYVRAAEIVPCPDCDGELRKRGWRRRGLLKANRKPYPLKVQRYIYKKCGKSHRGLPDIIVPYKRLEVKAIEQVINRIPTEGGNDERTIRHIFAWWEAMVDYVKRYMAAINEKYGELIIIHSPLSNLADIVRILVNSHKWPCTRFALLHET